MPQKPHPRFSAILFDMDGTVTKPSFDFKAIRKEIGLPFGDIVHEIGDLSAEQQKRAWKIIEAHEREAEQKQALQEGARDFILHCARCGLKTGIITRNLKRSVDALCQKFDLKFDAVITREFLHVKPHPGPILHMLDAWRIEPVRALMVGDYIHDIECGRAAGTQTCFFRNPDFKDYSAEADYSVDSMTEIKALVFGSSLEIKSSR